MIDLQSFRIYFIQASELNSRVKYAKYVHIHKIRTTKIASWISVIFIFFSYCGIWSLNSWIDNLFCLFLRVLFRYIF